VSRTRLAPVLTVALAALGSAVGGAAASPLVADLSNHLVAITTGFTGTDVLLFGATDGEGDVIVVVRGPERRVTMRRKENVAGIWINTAAMTFDRVPSFYTVAGSRPLEEIASESVRQRLEIGIDHLRIELPPAKASPSLATAWRNALIRSKERLNHYREEPVPVSFLGPRLFRSTVHFPANVPTGTYMVQVYLMRDGQVFSAQTTPLVVSKVGVGAEIFDFAHDQPALYGVVAIALALAAGWISYILFRRR
jgi:uncharacterized protein (TIGR02186 family)